MRLRQIEQLLDAVHEPLAPEAARSDGNDRLNDLEARAERVRPRVEKRKPPPAPVRGAHRHVGDHGKQGEKRAEDIGVIETGGEHHDGRHERERHGRAEVWLEQDQADQQAERPDAIGSSE